MSKALLYFSLRFSGYLGLPFVTLHASCHVLYKERVATAANGQRQVAWRDVHWLLVIEMPRTPKTVETCRDSIPSSLLSSAFLEGFDHPLRNN